MKTLSSKYYGEGGIHRVPLYRIAGFALNNTATNLYLFFMGYVAYYLGGFVGMATVLASSFAMLMRIWDGVTDPFVGYIVDKTNGKFGKNRPFMVGGQIILCVMSFIMFHVTHHLPDNGIIRSAFFIVCAAVFYIGYTFQCVVTKAAQTCLTNDPKQRPLFSIFDGIYNVVLFTGMAVVATSLGQKYGGFVSTELFHDFWVLVAVASAVCTIIAVWSIAPKDRMEFYGTGKAVRVSFKDYWEVLKNNRAIQMLVVAASTDKLASSAKTSAVQIVMFGVIAGNLSLQAAFTGFTSIPTMLLMILGIGGLATRLGQRKAMLIGSIGGIITNCLLALLWLFGDPKTLSLPGVGGFSGLTFFTVALLILTIMQGGFQGISGNIVIPMTADCADYEVYRSGRYVPGLMGTLFSFVDKLVSSFAPMIAGLLFSAIGFKDVMPDQNAPYSTQMLYVVVFLSYGIIILGLICNLIAMKFYPLTKEKMAEIQVQIAEIKAKAMEE